jgi:hypothetical protein
VSRVRRERRSRKDLRRARDHGDQRQADRREGTAAPGLRRSEIDHAVRLQNGDDITEVGRGSLETGGQLVLTLKPSEQGATKADVAELTDRLRRIETLLSRLR